MSRQIPIRHLYKMEDIKFKNRQEAGIILGRSLQDIVASRPVILALPRGGVPVAQKVAEALDAPLDILMVRKVGAPRNSEFAIGAVAEGGVQLLDQNMIEQMGVSQKDVEDALKLADGEIKMRSQSLRKDLPPIDFTGRDVIIVDDGLATGSTAQAAIEAARIRGARLVWIAVPVSSHQAAERLSHVADQVVTLHAPLDFRAVGLWYDDFAQVSTSEAKEILSKSREGLLIMSTIKLDVDVGVLEGDLTIPPNASGIVIFAHGSGSSRRSPRNQLVARHLQKAGLATLLLDLLTESEEQDRHNVFDIDLLSARLTRAIEWSVYDERTHSLPIGLFGASTGAAAALMAASSSNNVKAIVSRGGRPDLAGGHLDDPLPPTLLIIGSQDDQVLVLNQQARNKMTGISEIALVPGATHLFEELGALDQVCILAEDWFSKWLRP
jgi:putative phosphoribosyl transferase